MDADWKSLRSQTPWVKRLPSQYLSDHIRFSSQPMEESDRTEQLLQIIDWMDGGRTLMFSTDYPHWDFDNPRQAFPSLPEPLQRRIFVENALDAFPKMMS
jgi:predicted TIM-barrel fold metal-dependent hydrolase